MLEWILKINMLPRLLHMETLLAIFLRAIPMAAKLGLMLYMGRYLSLDAMGIYGLILGTVMLLLALLGQEFCYVVMRDIVGMSPINVLHKLRDEAILYGANYVFLVIVVICIVATGYTNMPTRYLWAIVILTIIEGYGAVTYYSMSSMHKPILANTIFCIRSGLWVIPVVCMGLLYPSWRSVDVVLAGWIAGGAVSLVVTLHFWRWMPWAKAMRRSVDWVWIRTGVSQSFPIWLSTIALAGGTYGDRFIVERFLTMSDVGVITFYFSFTNALIALMETVHFLVAPRLIQHHRDGNHRCFEDESRRALSQVAFGAGAAALLLAGVVPLLGVVSNRDALFSNAPALWLMLLAAWLRAVAGILLSCLYARHQDSAIWTGNLLFVIPALAGNALLVPILGINGVGVSSVLAAGLLFAWRWGHVQPRLRAGERRVSALALLRSRSCRDAP